MHYFLCNSRLNIGFDKAESDKSRELIGLLLNIFYVLNIFTGVHVWCINVSACNVKYFLQHVSL